jgi:hypothetical protein
MSCTLSAITLSFFLIIISDTAFPAVSSVRALTKALSTSSVQASQKILVMSKCIPERNKLTALISVKYLDGNVNPKVATQGINDLIILLSLRILNKLFQLSVFRVFNTSSINFLLFIWLNR